MPHPQSGQNLFAPRSTIQYHVQVFSKEHGEFISGSIHEDEKDALNTAKVITDGYKASRRRDIPKVRVVKVAKHTVYSEPEEVTPKDTSPAMSAADIRKLNKMMADQAKGPNAGRKKPAVKPRKQVIDLTDVDTSGATPKKKGK